MKQHYVFIFVTLVFILSSCAPSVYYVKPPDWEMKSKRDSAIAVYSKFFKGWKIFVDPGHGGEDRASHGPANDVVEADVNLRVALYLRDYLQAAGATSAQASRIYAAFHRETIA
jgi:N-acetylmuramoyl-L-alanine amidase